MQLSPKSPIPVSYTASIPGDITLYYVQAVLRDTASSVILQTLNLTRESSTPNRYVGTFNPVSDPSGLGRPVDVTISVYEDSGYTTLSANYQILQLSYVVLQPFIANLGNGGGGSNISYEKIRKTVREALQGEREETEDDEPTDEEQTFDPPEVPEPLDYGRIEGHAEELARSHRQMLGSAVEDIKGHVSAADKERVPLFLELGRALGALESKIGESSTISTKELRIAKDELRKTLEGLPNVLLTMHKDLHASVDKRLQAALEDMRRYLENMFSEKEIKMEFHNLGPQKKTLKDQPMAAYDPSKILTELMH